MRIPGSVAASRSGESAFTIAEAIVAVAVALIGMAAVMGLNAAHLRLVESARQSSSATFALQSRVEQMRLADWRKLTDVGYVKDTLLAQAPQSAASLGKMTESLTVSAYPDASACTPLIVEREQNGDRITLSSGEGLTNQCLAKVELLITWTGSNGKERTRATNTMICNGGISRMNLPAFGGSVAGSTSGSGGSTSGSGGSTSESGGSTGGNNGNGNGQGNVSGKPGKK
jgi:hypothetical protein